MCTFKYPEMSIFKPQNASNVFSGKIPPRSAWEYTALPMTRGEETGKEAEVERRRAWERKARWGISGSLIFEPPAKFCLRYCSV